MITQKMDWEADEPLDVCTYIRSLPDERLDLLVSVPILAQDLLEHAAYCRECGERIEAIDRQHFAQLPVEEQKACEEVAAAFISRNFASESAVPVSSTASSSDTSDSLSHLRRWFVERRAPKQWEFDRLGMLWRSIEFTYGSFQQVRTFGTVLGSPTVEYEHDLSGLLDGLGLANDFSKLKLAIQTGNQTRAAVLLVPRTASTSGAVEHPVILEVQLADTNGRRLSRKKISLRVGIETKSQFVRIEELNDPQSFAGQIKVAFRELPSTEDDVEDD